jgi:hypothetical protein
MPIAPRSAVLLLAGPVLLSLAGCGSDEASLPPPGARGEAVLHVWDRPGQEPLTVQTSAITQERPGDLTRLILRPVRVRTTNEDGTVFITAANGIYRRGERDTLVLEPNDEQDRVRLCGSWAGAPFMGAATRAVFRQDAHVLLLDGVEMVHQGRAQAVLPRRMVVSEGLEVETAVAYDQDRKQVQSGPNRDVSAPAVIAALAVLPRPLPLPVAPRGTRHQD